MVNLTVQVVGSDRSKGYVVSLGDRETPDNRVFNARRFQQEGGYAMTVWRVSPNTGVDTYVTNLVQFYQRLRIGAEAGKVGITDDKPGGLRFRQAGEIKEVPAYNAKEMRILTVDELCKELLTHPGGFGAVEHFWLNSPWAGFGFDNTAGSDTAWSPATGQLVVRASQDLSNDVAVLMSQTSGQRVSYEDLMPVLRMVYTFD